MVEKGWECTRVLGKVSVCTSTCGDGYYVGTEKCDDGNVIDSDG